MSDQPFDPFAPDSPIDDRSDEYTKLLEAVDHLARSTGHAPTSAEIIRHLASFRFIDGWQGETTLRLGELVAAGYLRCDAGAHALTPVGRATMTWTNPRREREPT